MPAASLSGVVPIVPTPFCADEQIDFEALGRCVCFAADAGLSAVCLPAYASEFYKLSESERAQCVETTIAAAGGRIAVMAQANHASARLAAETARRYEALGASYISFAIPRLFALPESDLQRIWTLHHAGRRDEALALFQVVLPQVVFALQSSELFNWIEKRLLQARGVLDEASTHVRAATWTPDEATLRYGDWLNEQIVRAAG